MAKEEMELAKTREEEEAKEAYDKAEEEEEAAKKEYEMAEKEKNRTNEEVRRNMERYSRDLGSHAGLLLGGIQRYFLLSDEADKDKQEKCNLLIGAVSGLLTGIPIAGFVFGPVGEVAKFIFNKASTTRHKKAREQVSQGIKDYLDESIFAQIFFDGKFGLKRKDGAREDIIIKEQEVQWEVFSKWYEQMIKWNQVYLSWRKDL